MITKEHLRVTTSSYFKTPDVINTYSRYTVTKDDVSDPSRIALKVGWAHNQWPLLLAFNSITDPINELTVGSSIIIPNNEDVKVLKK
jgi:hypothetical protein